MALFANEFFTYSTAIDCEDCASIFSLQTE